MISWDATNWPQHWFSTEANMEPPGWDSFWLRVWLGTESGYTWPNPQYDPVASPSSHAPRYLRFAWLNPAACRAVTMSPNAVTVLGTVTDTTVGTQDASCTQRT